MDALYQALSGAPAWVYFLFAYLVSLGIQSIRDRRVTLKRLGVVALFFLGWSAVDLLSKMHYPSLLIYWVFAMVLGVYLGYVLVSRWQLIFDRSAHTITIPGNYSTLLLIVVIFTLKFYWGYLYASSTHLGYGVYLSDVVTSGVINGIFVGRTVCFLRRYFEAKV